MEITEQEQAILKTLISPTEEEQHYNHDYKISQKIISLIVCDKHFLIQSIDLIKPEYFEDESHQLICRIVFDFFKQYKKMPPQEVIENEIKEKRASNVHLFSYLGELENIIRDYVPGLAPREYFIDRITEFAKEQSTRTAVSETLGLLKSKPKGKWNKIWELWKNALTIDKNQELGIDYFKSLEERYDKMMEHKGNKDMIFSSGFPGKVLNNGIHSDGIDGLLTAGGLCRGEIGAVVGLSGSGKSIFLINAAAENIRFGKKVCYLTLEMDETKIAKRFDALLSEVKFSELIDKKLIVFDNVRSHIRHEQQQFRLVIKHYPGGTADINTFRAYLSQLNLHSGFKPDMVVIDYVGELKDVQGVKTYETRQTQVRDLRALAVEEHVCVLTAFQANRRGREIQEFDGVIDDDALADSFGQVRPLDALWSINKVEGSNLGQLYVAKHRDGISKRQIYYQMNTDILRMEEISRNEFTTKKAEWKSKQQAQAAQNADNLIT